MDRMSAERLACLLTAKADAETELAALNRPLMASWRTWSSILGGVFSGAAIAWGAHAQILTAIAAMVAFMVASQAWDTVRRLQRRVDALQRLLYCREELARIESQGELKTQRPQVASLV